MSREPPQDLPPLDEMLRWANEARDPMRCRIVGFALSQAGRMNEAEKAYRMAIDAGDLGAYSNLGALLAKTERIAEALEALRVAIIADAKASTTISVLCS